MPLDLETLEGFSSPTDRELAELVLHHLGALVQSMDRITLGLFRADCLTRPTPVDSRILAMIAERQAALDHNKPASRNEK